MSEVTLLKYPDAPGRIVSMDDIEDAHDGLVRHHRDDGWDTGTDEASTASPPGFAMILIVEDGGPRVQACVRRLVTMAVSPRPANVVFASSAEDAIVLLRSFCFDLVVSDYDLGGSDGGQVLEHVQRHIPHMVARFVFFSGSEEPARLLPGRVIDKGVSPDRFVRDVRAMAPGDLRGQ